MKIMCGWCGQAESTMFSIVADKFLFSHCPKCWEEKKGLFRSAESVTKARWLQAWCSQCWTPPSTVGMKKAA